GSVGIRAGVAAAGYRLWIRATRDLRLRHPLYVDARHHHDARRQRHAVWYFFDISPLRRGGVAVRYERRVPGVRARSLVDSTERRMAARKRAAHSFQLDVGSG